MNLKDLKEHLNRDMADEAIRQLFFTADSMLKDIGEKKDRLNAKHRSEFKKANNSLDATLVLIERDWDIKNMSDEILGLFFTIVVSKLVEIINWCFKLNSKLKIL